ncbi:MAG: BatA domain-containing protein [Verrucomicrobiales bacterium]|nr:BatA domain-containing protein [Verrucomicrobiales bacterium]
MSFLAPLFLLGAAAVGLPIVFHLIRRTTKARTRFSSLLFLSPSPPRVTRRSRLEDLLLLLFRCLALMLLAFGFARPFLKNVTAVDQTAAAPKRILHLVDTSASMRREGLWDAALAQVSRSLRTANPSDEMAIWTFDRQARPLVTFAEWNAVSAGERPTVAESRLRALNPGWNATRLDEALTAAAEALVDRSTQSFSGIQRIVLVSDLQEGSRVEGLQAFDWPKGVDVALDPVKPSRPGNAGIQLVADSTSLPTTTQTVVRVRVVNSADATSGRFEVGWAHPNGSGFLGAAEEVLLPAGMSKVVALAVPADATVNHILLTGDGEDFDNHVYLVPPRTQATHAIYFGSDRREESGSPSYFLARALPPTGRLAATLSTQGPNDAVDPRRLADARIYFVTDTLPPNLAGELRRQVATGKTLVLAPRNPAALTSAAPLFQIATLAVEEANPKSYALLGTLNFQHPLLAPFADPRFSDFARIHFWKYRRMDATSLANANVVARFDNQDPALIDVPVERGRVLILTGGWHAEDSQLALSTKFVPLICSICEWASDEPAVATVWRVGDNLPVPPNASGGPRTLRIPGQPDQPLPAEATQIPDAPRPGIYEVASTGGILRLAVNLDGAESRTAALPLESIEALGTPLRTVGSTPQPDPIRKQQLAAAEAENRQKLWRWLMVATLAVLLMESAIAGWKSRRLQATGEATA